MLANWMRKIFGLNWKTNLAALVTAAASVPALATAVQNWIHHQPADWRSAIVGLVIAAALAFAKDKDVHSTPAEVAAAGDAPPQQPPQKPKDPPDR